MSGIEIFIGAYPNEEYKIKNLLRCLDSCRGFDLPINLVSSYSIDPEISLKFDSFTKLPINPLVRGCDYMEEEVIKKHWKKTKYKLNFSIGEELLGFSEIGGLSNLSHQWASTFTLQQSIKTAREKGCDWIIYSESDIEWIGSSFDLISSKIKELESRNECGIFLNPPELFSGHTLATHMIIKCNSPLGDLFLNLDVHKFYKITGYDPTVETCIYNLIKESGSNVKMLEVSYFEGGVDIFESPTSRQINLWSRASLEKEEDTDQENLSIFIHRDGNIFTFLNKNRSEEILDFALFKGEDKIFSGSLWENAFVRKKLILEGEYIIRISSGDKKASFTLEVSAFSTMKTTKTYKNRIDLLGELSERSPNGRGVEIGVFKGQFSKEILSRWNGTLYMVDVWRPLGEEYEDASNHSVHVNAYAETMERIKGLEERGIMIRANSKSASEIFPDESLDFIYIDANHAYDFVAEDIKLWFPKLKKGGIFAGHDYIDMDWYSDTVYAPNGKDKYIYLNSDEGPVYAGIFGVNPAVDEFCKENNYILEVTGEWLGTWWIIK